MTPHLSPLSLERYAVTDLPPAQIEVARVHLAECADCQGDFIALEARAARARDAWPKEPFMATLKARRRRESARRGAFFGTILALAAGGAVWIFSARQAEQTDRVALRGEGMAVHRQRDGAATRLLPGDPIRAGDALRVVVTLSKPAAVNVWFLDAAGNVDRPLTTEPVELGAGEHALPDSAVVSEPCLDLWVVVGVGPAASSSTEQALKRLGAGARDPSLRWLPRGAFAFPLRCQNE